jgi:hypothetical protein
MTSAENLAQLLNGDGVDTQSIQLNISAGLKNGASAVANMASIGNVVSPPPAPWPFLT